MDKNKQNPIRMHLEANPEQTLAQAAEAAIDGWNASDSDYELHTYLGWSEDELEAWEHDSALPRYLTLLPGLQELVIRGQDRDTILVTGRFRLEIELCAWRPMHLALSDGTLFKINYTKGLWHIDRVTDAGDAGDAFVFKQDTAGHDTRHSDVVVARGTFAWCCAGRASGPTPDTVIVTHL